MLFCAPKVFPRQLAVLENSTQGLAAELQVEGLPAVLQVPAKGHSELYLPLAEGHSSFVLLYVLPLAMKD